MTSLVKTAFGRTLLFHEEACRQAALRASRYRQVLCRYRSRNIRPRTLEVGDLVLRRILSIEGLFRVTHISRPDATRLKTTEGVPVQNAWNNQHLRKFYT